MKDTRKKNCEIRKLNLYEDVKQKSKGSTNMNVYMKMNGGKSVSKDGK